MAPEQDRGEWRGAGKLSWEKKKTGKKSGGEFGSDGGEWGRDGALGATVTVFIFCVYRGTGTSWNKRGNSTFMDCEAAVLGLCNKMLQITQSGQAFD